MIYNEIPINLESLSMNLGFIGYIGISKALPGFVHIHYSMPNPKCVTNHMFSFL